MLLMSQKESDKQFNFPVPHSKEDFANINRYAAVKIEKLEDKMLREKFK